MIPKSFDIDTAKEMVGDSRMRLIEAKARADADEGRYEVPKCRGGTYMERVDSSMEYVVYVTAHHKRLERLERIKQQSQITDKENQSE